MKINLTDNFGFVKNGLNLKLPFDGSSPLDVERETCFLEGVSLSWAVCWSWGGTCCSWYSFWSLGFFCWWCCLTAYDTGFGSLLQSSKESHSCHLTPSLFKNHTTLGFSLVDTWICFPYITSIDFTTGQFRGKVSLVETSMSITITDRCGS